MRKAADIRKEIAHPKIDFPVWVRIQRSPSRGNRIPVGTVWVGATLPSEKRCAILMDRLRELGYKPEMNGERGTAGQYIIEIAP